MQPIDTAPITPPVFRFLTVNDLQAVSERQVQWVWEGFLPAGGIALLTSVWKSGKTTLLSVLLAKMRQGGALAGLAVRPGRAVVLSEESPDVWSERNAKLGLGDQIEFSCRPFQGLPTQELWLAYLDQLVEHHRRQPIDLVVIDPLSSFLPNRAENDAGSILQALLPLQRLTCHAICVLILHHPKKGNALTGQAARGSGALTGFVDVSIEMKFHGEPNEDDRRRELAAWSRYEKTPRRLLIELNATGTDYHALGDFVSDDFPKGWLILKGILMDVADKLTRADIMSRWPNDHLKVNKATVWRWLDRAVKEGLLKQSGQGRKYAPFQYWLACNEERWALNPRQANDMPYWDEREALHRINMLMRKTSAIMGMQGDE
ncbi:MAG: helicase RepA family protein [Planctomycetes bacterium]|nr:helicase RepA family protein [Planctomycetota bacterium]